MLGVLLRMLNPISMVQGAVQSSGAVVADFFGTSSKKGRKTILLMILLGLLVVVPYLRVKMAERHADRLAHEAKEQAETLKADLARAEISRTEAEAAQQKEAEARAIEREEARRSQAKSDEYVKMFMAREATVTNRLKEVTNALNARKAGDAVAGDSAVILRNLGKVGVESAGGRSAAAAPTPTHPVPDPVGPLASAGPNAGPVAGSADQPSDGGVREATDSGGTQQ